MGNDPRRDLDHQLEIFEQKLLDAIARVVRWARGRGSGWVRIPLAVVLILGGFVGFLPILGFWMIPLGLVLIAQDVPFLRPPVARMLAWVNEKWRPGATPSRAPARGPRT